MKKIFLNLLFIMSLVACSENVAPSLKGKEFTLDNSKITLSFDGKENKFYGKAVNNYFGTYTLDKNNIKLELQGSTMMMGPENEMQAENKYFNDIKQVKSYTLNGNILTLKGDNIELRFKENK